MKHIQKNNAAPEVVAYQTKLQNRQLDRVSLSNPAVHPGETGPFIYDRRVKQIRPEFNNLKARMFQDQGGICCYCGQKLAYPNNPQFRVEHVSPKSLDRTLAGEYCNLLLSCRSHDVGEDVNVETWANANGVNYRERHCDEHKAAQVLTYTPLQTDCERHFIYDQFGGVAGDDAPATTDIATLNLNCNYLTKRREAAIEGELYDEDDNLLPDDEPQDRLNTIMQRDANGNFTEFCFVIKGAIEHVLA